uniref:hypothetical protein n=1 Tax=Klebsiella pneumoniae TaxID=573 RepID=UPI00373AEEBE
MILKEEIVLGIYSWLHMTPISMLVRNITSDEGGDHAIVRFTVDSRGVQMGPKAQGQLLCSFGFNVKETDEADKKDGPGIMKAEMMNGCHATGTGIHCTHGSSNPGNQERDIRF